LTSRQSLVGENHGSDRHADGACAPSQIDSQHEEMMVER
jgi:hypothetical protein